ncbi:spore germination protein [Paenibacillus flagellatus]|uniref:Spore germination protein n=1 Tax=Paenibacillus flagellatus TaxID=2211139 RepID=A0A2V5KBV3_9BACL|nr:spore germination protein [Paenibacillus flagellatus]PYI51380.1 spore germination protein [Paenibacillus flagellatus]
MTVELPELNEPKLRELFARSDDIRIESCEFGPAPVRHQVVLLYCEGMADTKLIHQLLLPRLHEMLGGVRTIDRELVERNETLLLRPIPGVGGKEGLMTSLYSGMLVLWFESAGLWYALDISDPPNRKPEESSTEVSIKGPRDAFTESVTTNVALIRKRLKSHSLRCEKTDIGVRSRTTVALLYIDDVANPEMVGEARRRLARIRIDGLVSSKQLEEELVDTPFSLFPLMNYIGRPDYAADSLLRGRMCLIVEGSPMALIAPANLALIVKSPEDVHFPFYYVAIERMLRFFGLLLAIFLPGFYIAVTAFHFDQIPFPLLATITSVRIGLPLSGPMDFYIMLFLFELFREAGMRLPKAVGQTIAVVGGLIVGDAAIRAGITGPATLVVVAISTMAMFTLVNQSLAGSVTLLRIIILIASTVLGMFGFMTAVVALALYLATLESFGVPYMAPLSPPTFRDLFLAIFAKPFRWIVRRPSFLRPVDGTRKRGDSS